MKRNGRETPYDELLDELRNKSVSELLDEQEVIWNNEEVDPDLLLAYDKVLVEKGHGAEDIDVDESLNTFKSKHPEFFPAPPVEVDKSAVTVVAFLPRLKKALLRHANILPTAMCFVMLFMFFARASNLFQMVTEITEGTYSAFRATGSVELPAGEKAKYHSLQEALDAYGIADKIEPTWIPESFVLKNVKDINSENGVMIIAQYVTDSGKEMSLFVSTDSSAIPKNEIDEQITPEDYYSNDVAFRLWPNLGQYTATWQTGSCFCSLNGDLSNQETKTILNSIFKE